MVFKQQKTSIPQRDEGYPRYHPNRLSHSPLNIITAKPSRHTIFRLEAQEWVQYLEGQKSFNLGFPLFGPLIFTISLHSN